MTTATDTAILREEVADKIASLIPLTQTGMEWRPAFERAIVAWRAKGNGQPEGSEYRRECFGWSVAHRFVLDDNAQ